MFTWPETLAWFTKHAIRTNPYTAYQNSQQWIGIPANEDREDKRKVQQLLFFSTDASHSAARTFLDTREGSIGRDLWEEFKWICDDRGWYEYMEAPPHNGGSLRKMRKIALIRQAVVPSAWYHAHVTQSIVSAAEDRNMLVSLHHVDPQNLAEGIQKVRRNAQPDAFIFLRLSPDEAAIKMLNGKPAALVHAHRKEYKFPVTTNVVACHDAIPRDLRQELNDIPDDAEVVLVTMPQERGRGSLRNDRIRKMCKGLERFGPNLQTVTIQDYSSRHGMRVFQEHREASAYVTTCDEVAVELKHLCAVGRSNRNYRIVGFDNSPLAKAEKISSFAQELDKIGPKVIEKLIQFANPGPDWPPVFEEIPLVVRLVTRRTDRPETKH